MIKLKHLQSYLEDIETFQAPKDNLEQYQTSSQIASEMFHYISSKHDLSDKIVLDLGAGTGILGIAAALCGAAYLYVILTLKIRLFC